MGVSSNGLPNQPRLLLPQRALAASLQRAVGTVASNETLDQVLTTILDVCSDPLGYLVPSIVLLQRANGRLAGRVISAPRTWDLLDQITERHGLPLDNILGGRAERRASSRRVLAEARPPRDAVSFSVEAAGNALVAAFVEGEPRLTPRYYDLVRPHLPQHLAASIQEILNLGDLLVVPVRVAGQSLGALVAASPAAQSVNEEDMAVLSVLAGAVASAIETERLRRELHERETQVSFLLKATIDAQEEERERICLDLHDGIAQTLASAFHHLQALESQSDLPEPTCASIRKVGKLVRGASREAREVITSLRPAALETVGLVGTLTSELSEMRVQRKWQVTIDADQGRLPKPVETALYRILHEAVTNIAKHAHARSVALRIRHTRGGIVAEVRDDGRGFDASALKRSPHHRGVGLLSMRKRTELLQGQFEVKSDVGEGTLVRVEIPLQADQAAGPWPPTVAVRAHGPSPPAPAA